MGIVGIVCIVMINWVNMWGSYSFQHQFVCLFLTHTIHATVIFTYVYHKNQPNYVGKYTVRPMDVYHTWMVWVTFFFSIHIDLKVFHPFPCCQVMKFIRSLRQLVESVMHTMRRARTTHQLGRKKSVAADVKCDILYNYQILSAPYYTHSKNTFFYFGYLYISFMDMAYVSFPSPLNSLKNKVTIGHLYVLVGGTYLTYPHAGLWLGPCCCWSLGLLR